MMDALLARFRRREETPAPAAAPSRAERFVARFERELAGAATQAEQDEARGRLAYWCKVRDRG